MPRKGAMQAGCKTPKIAWESAPAGCSCKSQNSPTCSPGVGFGSQPPSCDPEAQHAGGYKNGEGFCHPTSQRRLWGWREIHGNSTCLVRSHTRFVPSWGVGETGHYYGTIAAQVSFQAVGIEAGNEIVLQNIASGHWKVTHWKTVTHDYYTLVGVDGATAHPSLSITVFSLAFGRKPSAVGQPPSVNLTLRSLLVLLFPCVYCAPPVGLGSPWSWEASPHWHLPEVGRAAGSRLVLTRCSPCLSLTWSLTLTVKSTCGSAGGFQSIPHHITHLYLGREKAKLFWRLLKHQ